jgi:1,4-dihydroxy-2-naphthoate octaprenyltransferase
MGQVGRIIGGPQHSVNNAAFVILAFLCVILAATVFFPAAKDSNLTTALISPITGSLGYIFGRGKGSP